MPLGDFGPLIEEETECACDELEGGSGGCDCCCCDHSSWQMVVYYDRDYFHRPSVVPAEDESHLSVVHASVVDDYRMDLKRK